MLPRSPSWVVFLRPPPRARGRRRGIVIYLFEISIHSFVSLARASCAGGCAVDLGLQLPMDVRLQQTVERLTQNDPTLQKLKLEGIFIGDAGAQAIADALRQNSTLQQLELRGNGIGDEGAQAITDALRESSTLAKLHLENNRIGDGVFRTIQDLLEEKRIARKAARLAAQLIVPRLNLPEQTIKETIQLFLVTPTVFASFAPSVAPAAVTT